MIIGGLVRLTKKALYFLGAAAMEKIIFGVYKCPHKISIAPGGLNFFDLYQQCNRENIETRIKNLTTNKEKTMETMNQEQACKAMLDGKKVTNKGNARNDYMYFDIGRGFIFVDVSGKTHNLRGSLTNYKEFELYVEPKKPLREIASKDMAAFIHKKHGEIHLVSANSESHKDYGEDVDLEQVKLIP